MKMMFAAEFRNFDAARLNCYQCTVRGKFSI